MPGPSGRDCQLPESPAGEGEGRPGPTPGPCLPCGALGLQPPREWVGAQAGRSWFSLDSSLTPGPPPQSEPRSGGMCAGVSEKRMACARAPLLGPPSPSMTAAVARAAVGAPSAARARRAVLVSRLGRIGQREYGGGSRGASTTLTTDRPSQGPSARRRRARAIPSGTQAPCSWGSPREVNIVGGDRGGVAAIAGVVLTSCSPGRRRRGQLGGGFGRVPLR